MRLANSDADTRGQSPPVDYVEPDAPATITNPITLPIVRDDETPPFAYRTAGTETRPARRSIAFFSRLSEGHHLRGGDHANGLHAVIARQANGTPQGQQMAWPMAQPATLFRPPQPWDRGNVRATPDAGAGA